jgi:hypothetical protein
LRVRALYGLPTHGKAAKPKIGFATEDDLARNIFVYFCAAVGGIYGIAPAAK